MDEQVSFTWVVVVADGTRFIGKTGYSADLQSREAILENITCGGSVRLNPCYEYPIFADTSDKGMRKIPLPNSLDMMLDPCDVYLFNISRIVFFDDMSADDRKLMERFVSELEKALLRQKAARSGIELLKGS